MRWWKRAIGSAPEGKPSHRSRRLVLNCQSTRTCLLGPQALGTSTCYRRPTKTESPATRSLTWQRGSFSWKGMSRRGSGPFLVLLSLAEARQCYDSWRGIRNERIARDDRVRRLAEVPFPDRSCEGSRRWEPSRGSAPTSPSSRLSEAQVAARRQHPQMQALPRPSAGWTGT
jgi:hypothetical protein